LTDRPNNVIQLLKGHGINAIVPIQDWELLGEKKDFPNALKLTLETVSLPLYPLLSDSDVGKIISAFEGVEL
jgi:dTDP-4-amino-4,6-dideoxygalactose transaminase